MSQPVTAQGTKWGHLDLCWMTYICGITSSRQLQGLPSSLQSLTLKDFNEKLGLVVPIVFCHGSRKWMIYGWFGQGVSFCCPSEQWFKSTLDVFHDSGFLLHKIGEYHNPRGIQEKALSTSFYRDSWTSPSGDISGHLLDPPVWCQPVPIWLVVSNMTFIVHFIYGMSSFPLT